MATKYARAAGGNWSADATWSLSSGGAADTVAPNSADDCILDAASGNVTIDAGGTRNCKSLDCNGYTGTLTHAASTTLGIGNSGSAGAGNRMLRLSAGMTYTINSGSAFAISGVSGTVQTITTAGKTMPYTQPSGVGSYQLTDSFSTASTFDHVGGTFDTNNQTVSCGIFQSTGSTTRTLTLGSSAITCTSTGTAWSAATVTNLTVTANTATVTLTGSAATFASGNQNWNGMSVVMSGSGTQVWNCSSGCTVQNLTRIGTASKTDAFQINVAVSGCVANGTLTITGNSLTNRILVFCSGLGTAKTITAGAVSLTNVDFRDITAAGAAIPWTGTSMGNALGNTNITFDTPTTRYGVAAGNWSSTSMWSTSSGGAPGASVPLPQDNVVLDANSAAGTYTIDMPRVGADLTCTGFTRTLDFSSTNDIYGSVTLASGMTCTGIGTTSLLGRSSYLITSAGKTWTQRFNFYAGTYTLADAFTNSRSATSITVDLIGALNDGGFAISLTGAAGGLAGSAVTSTITLSGTTTITSTTNAAPWVVTFAILNHTGTIILSGANAIDRTFTGGSLPKTYGTLTDQNTLGGKLTITGANTFTTINKTATVACTLTLPSAATTTVTNFNVNGIAGNLLTLNSSTPTSAAILSKPTGLVSCDYLSIQDSTATGGARYFAGTHSTNVSGNTGWNFIAPTYNTSSTGIIA